MIAPERDEKEIECDDYVPDSYRWGTIDYPNFEVHAVARACRRVFLQGSGTLHGARHTHAVVLRDVKLSREQALCLLSGEDAEDVLERVRLNSNGSSLNEYLAHYFVASSDFVRYRSPSRLDWLVVAEDCCGWARPDWMNELKRMSVWSEVW